MNQVYDVVPTPVGPCSVVVRDGKLIAVRLSPRPGVRARRKRMPQLRRSVLDCIRGRATRVALDFSSCTPFERRVYEVVRRIPPGRTRTYGEVARLAGCPGAARAVGNAMARNPICLFVP